MRYVLDANVALKWVLPEPDSPKARRLRDEFQRGIHDLLAPDVFEVEIAHALTRAERQGRIAVGQAGILWADIMSTPPLLQRSGPLVPRAIAISSILRIGVYDCLYVALAERESCEMVTADAKLVTNLQAQFPSSERSRRSGEQPNTQATSKLRRPGRKTIGSLRVPGKNCSRYSERTGCACIPAGVR